MKPMKKHAEEEYRRGSAQIAAFLAGALAHTLGEMQREGTVLKIASIDLEADKDGNYTRRIIVTTEAGFDVVVSVDPLL